MVLGAIVRREDKEILPNARIQRVDHAQRPVLHKGAYHGAGGMLDDALDNSAALTVGPAAQAGMNAVAVHGLAKPAAGEPELALRAFHIARSLRNMNRADKAGLALGARRALAAAAPPLFASHRRTPFRARRSVRVARRYIKSGSSCESSSKNEGTANRCCYTQTKPGRDLDMAMRICCTHLAEVPPGIYVQAVMAVRPTRRTFWTSIARR